MFGRRLDPSLRELHYLGEATLDEGPLHRDSSEQVRAAARSMTQIGLGPQPP